MTESAEVKTISLDIPFTAGPWTASSMTVFATKYGKTLVVADGDLDNGISFAEARANAHLIAAAPELYGYALMGAIQGDPVAIELIAKARGDQP